MSKIENNFWNKYSVWIYRVILILILVFIANIGAVIIFLDTWNNPPQREPNRDDLSISSKEDSALLDKTIKTIHPEGIDNLSQETQAIDTLRFVVVNIKNINNLGLATKILTDGYAVCGGKSVVFQTLLKKQGIPARQVELFNTPDSGHTVVEAYYDESWHLFDSSYGVFAYSNQNYDKQGNIINMFELSKNRELGYLQGVTDTPWTGQYSDVTKAYGVKALSSENPSLDKSWRNEIKPAYPIIYGEHNLYKYYRLLVTFNTTDLKLKLSQIF